MDFPDISNYLILTRKSYLILIGLKGWLSSLLERDANSVFSPLVCLSEFYPQALIQARPYGKEPL